MGVRTGGVGARRRDAAAPASSVSVGRGGGRRKGRTVGQRERGWNGCVVMMASAGVPPAWPGRASVPEENAALGGAGGPKKFSLIGSTGSIGTQTLDIVREHPQLFSIEAMACGSNVSLFAEQVLEFGPKLAVVGSASLLDELRAALEAGGLRSGEDMPELASGPEGLVDVAKFDGAESVVTGIVGCAGLQPTMAAIDAGKDICLANKETLIAGGPAVLPLARERGVKILPADSEHSALFQCIQGLPEGGLRRIILTASGGAFRDWPVSKLKDVRVADALKHPNWSMGQKITVDSATLMNKGLEVIEAHYLFGADYDNIDIVVHPQSIVHSMVETADSSVLAQLGWPDMRLPILYTMSWPHRVETSEETWPRLDFVKMGDLTFREPDSAKYPSMRVCYDAGRTGGTMTGVLSAANEKAVELFLAERISYLDIVNVVEKTCEKHADELLLSPSLEDIVHYDAWARTYAETAAETCTAPSVTM